MPHERVTTKTIFYFDELSDAAKEKARDWYRSFLHEFLDFEHLYDDFENVGKILGITINRVQHGSKPAIYWSGFSSQGDGACFEGSYEYAKGARKAIREYAPQDLQLHHIADELQKLQSRFFYRLTATVKHRGHYYHEYCTTIDIDAPEWITAEAFKDAEGRLTELLRDYMRWLYSSLEKENDWQYADEQVDESIKANEYEFEEDGTRA